MKLLFDHHLSPKLVRRLDDLYPSSEHVYHLGLDLSPDQEIWAHAREQDFLVVTKDADFADLNVLLGFPPKVIWIRRGNCQTAVIESILRTNFAAIDSFSNDDTLGMLILT